MCALRYEHEFYVQARKRFPKEGRQLQTSQGMETVMSINIFADCLILKGPSGETRSVGLEELKRETAQARET